MDDTQAIGVPLLLGAAFLALLFVALTVMVRIWRRNKLRRLERDIRAARADAARSPDYRALAAREHDTLRCELDDPAEKLKRAGFVFLGDLVDDSDPPRVTRWFLDGDPTIIASISMIDAHYGRTPSITLSSVTANGSVLSTQRGPTVRRLAAPPFVRRLDVGPDTSISRLLELHRRGRGQTRCVAFATLDDVVRVIAQTAARTVEWRASQLPDALLEADLRSVLGLAFQRLHRSFAARIGANIGLPAARLVRSPRDQS